MAAPLGSLALWVVAALVLWLHTLAGIAGQYIGQGYPVYPALKVSAASLAFDAVATTVPVALAAAFARWRRIRAFWPLSVTLIGLLWLWAGNEMVFAFTIDFGTTWRGTEAFCALFLHPVHTPLALAALAFASYRLIAPRGRAR